MTRLKTSDICKISSGLTVYNNRLQACTGRSLLGIASHAWGVDETELIRQIKRFSIHVVPVTAGQGIITDFSETVGAILRFLGFNAMVADQFDISGIASALEKKADAIMMADDNRFVGVNLHNRKVADNSEATGRVFAAALDLMTGGIKDHGVLIMGCGPVGEAAAEKFLNLGACVVLCDIYPEVALSLREKLSRNLKNSGIQVEENPSSALPGIANILEATPSKNTIPDELISDHLRVSAPGVPIGVSDVGCEMLNRRLVHDTLELGVAAMAVKLILNQNQGK